MTGTLNTNGLSAAAIREEAKRAKAIVRELERQAAIAARAEEAAKRPAAPDLSEGPRVVTFTKYMGGQEYAYAALGWRVGKSMRWTVTGQTNDRFNWAGLLAFIGEANWPSLHLVTETEAIPVPERPVAEKMGAYGRVRDTELVEPYHGKAGSFQREGVSGYMCW